MKRIYCDNCKKEINKVYIIDIYYNTKSAKMHWQRYELCNACFKAMEKQIPTLLNWRSRLR